MRIATWNVNSIKQRIEHLLTFLREVVPDVVLLQETKCVDEAFPRLEIEALGYNCAVHGQKTFNGVAILARRPLDDVRQRLPGGDGDDHARYIEAVVPAETGIVRVASIYLPNGNPAGTDKYGYKLAWMDRLIAHTRTLLALEEPLVLGGDYNVIPTPDDVHDPRAWMGDALFLPQTREKFRELMGLGLVDALRACNADKQVYTFWDYQAGAWQKNNGIRIDHLILSPQAADRLRSCVVEKRVRSWEKPSDHVPVVADFAL